MPEKIRKVEVYQRLYRCDEKVKDVACSGQLFLTPDGQPAQIDPELYRHRCSVCGKEKFLGARFPQMITWPEGEPLPKDWVAPLLENLTAPERPA